jgi:DNA-binding Xre family transcriptional regulator
MSVRLKVKEVAKRQGFSQRKLSLQSGVDINTVRRLFQHPESNVSVVTLGRLADTMGVNVSELIESVPDIL